jgi:hypothetical protein
VLGWCSPQSSVPRQTVGHHARAAKYETGPTAACEGCRGEVPEAPKQRLPRHPPRRAGVSLFFSHTHRPGRSGAHGPAGSGVDFPTPQNSFVWVSLKIGSRARKRTQSAPQTGEEARASARGTRGFGTKPAHSIASCALCPSRLARSFLIYPPTRAQWGARAGGLWGGFPDPEKPICMRFAKNRLASSQPHTKCTSIRAARAGCRGPAAAPLHHSGGACGRPKPPTLYPWSPTLYPPSRAAPRYPPTRPPYTLAQPAYPIPALPGAPTSPTLNLIASVPTR